MLQLQAVFVSLQIVRKHYGHFARQEATLQVRFEQSKISLDIPEDGQVTKDGWRITPRTHPTVSEHQSAKKYLSYTMLHHY